MAPMSVRQAARAALSLTDPAAKVAATHVLWQQAGAADLASEAAVSAAELIAREPAPIPGRPDQPKLVHPKEVAQRSVHTPAGRAALLAIRLAPIWSCWSVPRTSTRYAPSGMTGVVYEKLLLGLPGLVRKAVRQLGEVLVNVPLLPMYRPAESTTATSTLAMLWSS